MPAKAPAAGVRVLRAVKLTSTARSMSAAAAPGGREESLGRVRSCCGGKAGIGGFNLLTALMSFNLTTWWKVNIFYKIKVCKGNLSDFPIVARDQLKGSLMNTARQFCVPSLEVNVGSPWESQMHLHWLLKTKPVGTSTSAEGSVFYASSTPVITGVFSFLLYTEESTTQQSCVSVISEAGKPPLKMRVRTENG